MKHMRLLATLLSLCLILSACGGPAPQQGAASAAPAQEEPKEDAGSTLVIAIQDEIEGCDVQQVGWANVVHDLIFEPLVVYNVDLDAINPSFAESYTATDEYLEFVLPADARFSNGSVLDAAAVKASFERFLAISEYAEDLEVVSDIEAVDARTVRFNLRSPAPYIWSDLAIMFGGIVDAAAAEQVGEWEFNKHPVGNGAYYVDEWVAGSHITLKRNEYYRTSNPDVKNHGAAPFETVVVRFIPDGEERVNALLSGDVDIIYSVPPDSVASLRGNPGVVTYDCQLTGVSFLNLQTNKGVLADIRLRQALTYAVDRYAIRDALDGVVTPTFCLLSDSQFGHSEAEEAKLAKELAYDPARSRQLLEEAGWRDSNGDGIVDKGGRELSMEMMIPSDSSTFRAAAPLLREQLAAVGIDAQIREEEADYIKELMREDDYTIGSRTYEWMDANILDMVFTEGSGYGWDDPELTKVLMEARQKTDMSERVKAYELASDLLAQDFKAISLYSDGIFIATGSGIGGFVVCADGRTWLSDVTKG